MNTSTRGSRNIMPKAGSSTTYCLRSTCFQSCYCILATCIVFISSFLHQRAGIAWVFGSCFITRSRKYPWAIAHRKEFFFDTDVRFAFYSFLICFAMLIHQSLVSIGGFHRSRPDSCRKTRGLQTVAQPRRNIVVRCIHRFYLRKEGPMGR